MPHDSVPTPTAAPTVPATNQFTIAGRVDGWKLDTRQLTIGVRNLWVADNVLVGRLAIGVKIVASGHEPAAGAQWIVTHFSLD